MDINYIIWENAAVKVASTFDFTFFKTSETAAKWASEFKDPNSEFSIENTFTRKRIVAEYERLVVLHGD